MRFTKTRMLLMTFGVMLVMGVASATASATPYVWSTNGSNYVPMYYAPNTQYSNVKTWMLNGTRFNMICWLDNWGNRWFYGQSYTGYWGYVTAGPVRNQISVRHC
jgi:hypothetical protein